MIRGGSFRDHVGVSMELGYCLSTSYRLSDERVERDNAIRLALVDDAPPRVAPAGVWRAFPWSCPLCGKRGNLRASEHEYVCHDCAIVYPSMVDP